MKKYFALTVVFLALISLASVVRIAFAGPEPLPSGKEMKEVAPAPPPCDWTGFYIGVNGGFGGGDLTWKNGTDPDLGPSQIVTHQEPSGFFGGGQIGYNHQFGSWLVLGLEGDFVYGNIDDEITSKIPDEDGETSTVKTDNHWTGTIALRAGLTSWNNRLLSYVKGGAAFAHWRYEWKQDEGGGDFNTFDTHETRAAPMLGFGLEYAITCRWSAKVEYRHLFLGTESVTAFKHPEETDSFGVELHQDSVQVGLNYKFWSF